MRSHQIRVGFGTISVFCGVLVISGDDVWWRVTVLAEVHGPCMAVGALRFSAVKHGDTWLFGDRASVGAWRRVRARVVFRWSLSCLKPSPSMFGVEPKPF